MPEACAFLAGEVFNRIQHSDEHVFRCSAAGLRRPHSYGRFSRFSRQPTLAAAAPHARREPHLQEQSSLLRDDLQPDHRLGLRHHDILPRAFVPRSPSQTPSWSKEYQFDSAYDVSSFSAANLSSIAASIRSGGAARSTFEKDYAVSTPSPITSSNFSYLFLRADLFHCGKLQQLRLRCGPTRIAKTCALNHP